MTNKLKESALIFFGTIGLTLIIVKALGLFSITAEWLYIPSVIIGFATAIYEYVKR